MVHDQTSKREVGSPMKLACSATRWPFRQTHTHETETHRDTQRHTDTQTHRHTECLSHSRQVALPDDEGRRRRRPDLFSMWVWGFCGGVREPLRRERWARAPSG